MARDRSSIVKMSRREGYALHPKAHKVLVRRTGPPGEVTNARRRKSSQYSLQLREKQKVRRLYGLLERQFANLMKESAKRPEQTGEVLLQYLERRLDNAVYRSGLAPSRRAARQLVNHGHFTLNGRRVNIPSIRVKIGDELKVRGKSQKSEYFKHLDDNSPVPSVVPEWIKVNRKSLEFKVNALPVRDDAEPDINEQLIVEYYSR